MDASRTVLSAHLDKERATTAIVISHTHTTLTLLHVKVRDLDFVNIVTTCSFQHKLTN